MFHHEGELAVARAAGHAGVAYGVPVATAQICTLSVRRGSAALEGPHSATAHVAPRVRRGAIGDLAVVVLRVRRGGAGRPPRLSRFRSGGPPTRTAAASLARARARQARARTRRPGLETLAWRPQTGSACRSPSDSSAPRLPRCCSSTNGTVALRGRLASADGCRGGRASIESGGHRRCRRSDHARTHQAALHVLGRLRRPWRSDHWPRRRRRRDRSPWW